MQFSVIPRTLLYGKVLPLSREYSHCILSPTNRVGSQKSDKNKMNNKENIQAKEEKIVKSLDISGKPFKILLEFPYEKFPKEKKSN